MSSTYLGNGKVKGSSAYHEGRDSMGNQDAYEFFQKLESYLNRVIPCPDLMRDEITRTVIESKSNDDGHMRFPEGGYWQVNCPKLLESSHEYI